MDLQILFNIAVALSGGLGGFILKLIWDAIKEVQTADTKLTSEVSELKVMVAGEYVRRTEYKSDLQAISDGIKRIEDKLDGKADK